MEHWAGNALLQASKERRKIDRQRCGLAARLPRNCGVKNARRVFHLGSQAKAKFQAARAESGPRKRNRAKPKAVPILGPFFGPKNGTEKRDHFLKPLWIYILPRNRDRKTVPFLGPKNGPKNGTAFRRDCAAISTCADTKMWVRNVAYVLASTARIRRVCALASTATSGLSCCADACSGAGVCAFALSWFSMFCFSHLRRSEAARFSLKELCAHAAYKDVDARMALRCKRRVSVGARARVACARVACARARTRANLRQRLVAQPSRPDSMLERVRKLPCSLLPRPHTQQEAHGPGSEGCCCVGMTEPLPQSNSN